MEYNSSLPIYLQVANLIKRDIVTGKRELGEKLPSVRELAVSYTINPNTVSRVYKELETEGVCFTRRGMGTFVTEDSEKVKNMKEEMAGTLIHEFLEGMQQLGVTKNYAGKAAVDNVSLKLETGLVYAMLGPNGSGKTTWMKMVAGLVKPGKGEILYKGKAIGKESKKEIAYMSTEPYFYSWMTVADVGRYYQDFFEDFSMEKYHQMLKRMELTEELKTKKLSTGMMAKLKIAVTMARNAKLYLLDEPLNGIDLLARDEIMKSILEVIDPDVTLVISSHLVDELERVADAAIFMKEGKMVRQCMVEELRSSEKKSVVDLYREIYGHGGEELC